MPRPEPRVFRRHRARYDAGLAMLEALAAVYLTPTTRKAGAMAWPAHPDDDLDADGVPQPSQATVEQVCRAASISLAHVFGIPAEAPSRQNLSAQAPSRQRSGLSARQRQALDAIRQRGRSTSEVAAILGTTDSEAHKTVLSLVRRHKVKLTTTQPRRWVAVWKPDA